jgi:hypothetical protein
MEKPDKIDDLQQPENQPKAEKKKRLPIPILLVGIVVIALAIAGGIGYWDGNRQRAAINQQELESYLVDQYNLALDDLQAGRYDFAQQRLNEIVAHNANYPGAKDALGKIAQLMNATPTPIPTTTAIPTPTPNITLGEQMRQKALQQYKDKDFQGMVQTLLGIQRDVPSFTPLRIEGLLFIGYREEGMADIRALNLERGMYRLWLASRYGPLDAEAINKIDWSKQVLFYYQSAYRFRKSDLEKSISAFSEVYILAPGYRPTLAKDYQDTLDAYIKQISTDNCYIRNKLNELLGDPQRNDSIMIAKRDEAAGKCTQPTTVSSPAP